LEGGLETEIVVVLGLVLPVLAGVAIIWMAMRSRWQIREMAHRERLAMIERGLVPPPETDPETFERQTGIARMPESPSATRTRSAGVIMIGFGLALTFLIAFAAESPSVGIGIGGAFAVLGAAFYYNAMLLGRSDATRGPIATTAPPPRREQEPPPPPTT
jgi:hypothetical protein